MNEYNPDYISPPGETILESMKHHKLSREEFGNKIGMKGVLLDNLLTGKHPIDLTLAEKLEEVLGADAQFWINRQKIYYEAMMEKIEDRNKQRSRWLASWGFIACIILGFLLIAFGTFFVKISWTMIKWIWYLW